MKNYKHILSLAVFFVAVGLYSAIGQTRTIRGKVSSAKDGKPLTSASVKIYGSSSGVQTDADGDYSITVSATDKKLEFSFVDFKTQSLDIPTNSDILNVTMEEDLVGSNRVTVTALGIKKEQRALGFSSQTVTGKEIAGSGEQNVIQAISAKAAGALVTGSSGTPGASTKIVLRGAATFTNENQPLVVVDGVPIDNSTTATVAGDYPFNMNLQGVNNSNRAVDINPDDIESINVLKGPAAAALYGVRGANGAIIITTKRGKAGQAGSNLAVTYSTSIEFAQVNKLPEKQMKYGQGDRGGAQYIDSAGVKKAWTAGAAIPAGWRIADEGRANPNVPDSWGPVTANPVDNAKNFFQTGVTYNNNLSVAFGGQATQVRVSMGNLRQEGIVPNSKFDRTSIRVNTDSKISDELSFGTSMNYIKSGGTRVQNGSNLSGIMLSLMRSPNDFDLAGGKGEKNYLNPDGSMYTYFSIYDNPYWSVYENPFTDDVNRLLGNMYVSYNPLKWLSATYRVGTDVYTDARKSIFAVGSWQPDNSPGGEINQNVIRSREIYSDLLVTGRHSFNEDLQGSLTLGNNLNTRQSWNQFLRGRDLSVPYFYNLSNASNLYSSNSEATVKTAALMFNAEMSYKRMLYLNVTARNEWASTFGTAKNSFLYPSANASFVFSELMQNNKILSFGKVRLAYAQAGINPPAYATRTYYVQPTFTDGFTGGLNFPYLGQNGFGQGNTLGNSALKPEKNTGREIGFDLRFLNGRVNLDLTLYNQKSTDIIVARPLAPSSGYEQIISNNGEMENKGIEMILGGSPIKNDNFTWDISLNFASNRNKVLKLAQGVDEINIESAFSSNGSYAIVGEPYGVIYGSRWQRNSSGALLIGSNGLPLVDSKFGNIGVPIPKWYGGLRNSFNYKGVNLTFLIDVRKGGDIWNGTYARMTRLGLTKETEDRNRTYVIEGVKASDGTPNDKPVSAYNYFRTYKGDGGAYASENAIQDGGWVRLREVGLSYTIKVPNVKHFTSIDLGFIAKNLWLKTDYKGVDPETSLTGAGSNIGGFDYFNNPGLKSFLFSAKFNFN